MKIGILQTGHTPQEVEARNGDFTQMFQSLLAGHDFTFETWNVVDMEFPNGPTDADGWLLTGSKHGAYEDHPFIAPLEELIRAIRDSARPMIGICFGHQIIAQALGGKVEKFAGGWAIGRHDYKDKNLGDIALNCWHQDQVVSLPEGARVTASSPHCAHAGIVYGDTIYTLQPHPELSNAIIHDYLVVRGDEPTYPREIVHKARAENTLPNDEPRVALQMAEFFKGVAIP